MHPQSPSSESRFSLKRVVTCDEAEFLRSRLVEMNCRNISFHSDFDGGMYWTCTVGRAPFSADVSINGWNPSAPPCIQIAAPSAAAVARIAKRIWGLEVHVDDLLSRSDYGTMHHNPGA